jgi:DNA primase
MITTGVATMPSTGRLIDRFRDRVVFPIIHDGEILGFIGRRHPRLSDIDRAGPKYLNTDETPVFHKGAQLYGDLQRQRSAGAIPVIVEGPWMPLQSPSPATDATSASLHSAHH